MTTTTNQLNAVEAAVNDLSYGFTMFSANRIAETMKTDPQAGAADYSQAISSFKVPAERIEFMVMIQKAMGE